MYHIPVNIPDNSAIYGTEHGNYPKAEWPIGNDQANTSSPMTETQQKIRPFTGYELDPFYHGSNVIHTTRPDDPRPIFNAGQPRHTNSIQMGDEKDDFVFIGKSDHLIVPDIPDIPGGSVAPKAGPISVKRAAVQEANWHTYDMTSTVDLNMPILGEINNQHSKADSKVPVREDPSPLEAIHALAGIEHNHIMNNFGSDQSRLTNTNNAIKSLIGINHEIPADAHKVGQIIPERNVADLNMGTKDSNSGLFHIMKSLGPQKGVPSHFDKKHYVINALGEFK